MRTSLLHLLVCNGLLALVAGFTKEDHEIFRLRDEIEATEGSDVNFYGELRVRRQRSVADSCVTCRLSRCEAERFSGRSHQSFQEKRQNNTPGQGQAVFGSLESKINLQAFTWSEEEARRERQ